MKKYSEPPTVNNTYTFKTYDIVKKTCIYVKTKIYGQLPIIIILK